jgi:hypothetical protein
MYYAAATLETPGEYVLTAREEDWLHKTTERHAREAFDNRLEVATDWWSDAKRSEGTDAGYLAHGKFDAAAWAYAADPSEMNRLRFDSAYKVLRELFVVERGTDDERIKELAWEEMFGETV